MQIGIFHRPEKRSCCLSSLWVIFFILVTIAQTAHGQAVKILPIGDSWTEGVGHHVSYRYDLWFNLIDAGFNVDFVGNKSNTFDGPSMNLYPKYLTEFDRDHQASAGARSDALVNVAKSAAATHEPDIVLLWAGGADLGWLGSTGATNANFGIRDIIEGVRQFVPGVTILLAQSPPYIGNGSDFVESLNAVVATIASDLNTTESPIILVDHYTGYDIVSMTQGDNDHQNRVGEAWVAQNWFEALEKIIPDIEPNSGFSINAGLNDAWYDPVTDGQGFFITVFPELGIVVLAWFTYDTELPPDEAPSNLGDAGHRWLLAVGTFANNVAMLDIEIASGGLFDTSTEIDRVGDGSIILTFEDCNKGTVEYDIPSIGQQGTVPIERVAADNIALCEALIAD